MQQMASLVLLLAIFAGFEQVLCERGSAARNVVGDVREKFTTTGGAAVQRPLFRQRANKAAAVEGGLYSIDVAEGKSFVRVALMENQDVTSMDTGLEADQGVVQCAIKALEVGAEMYKYDGLCWVHLQDVSQEILTTDCGAGDAVYIRKPCSPDEFKCNDGECVAYNFTCDGTADCAEGEDELVCDFNIYKGERIEYGEYSGCFYSTPNGMTFGETSDRLVEEHLPTEKIPCCPFMFGGICAYVDDIATKDINFCEAVARCEAFGLPLLSNQIGNMYLGFLLSDLAVSGDVVGGYPLNYVRDDQGVWRWMPYGGIDPQLTLDPNEANVGENCIVKDLEKGKYVSANCEDAVGYNSVCVDPYSQLPQCA